MTNSDTYTRVMSREEYDGAIAAGEETNEGPVIVVEPLGEPQPISATRKRIGWPMAEPRRSWDRARERIERALEHLRRPNPRMASSASDELVRALEDLAGTEGAVAPVYVVVRDRTGEHLIRGLYTTREAASDATAGERWVDVEEGVERLMETGHRNCCSIEEWLVLDEPRDMGDGRIRPHQHAWIQVTDADGNAGRHCRLPGCHALAPAVG